MKTVIIAAVVCAGTAAVASAQSTRRTKVVQPERIAVAMRQGEQLFPFTVEATNTGWISISFLPTRPDAGLLAPPFRMMAEARDVKEWVARARTLLQSPPDSNMRSDRVVLGNGLYDIEISRPRGSQSPVFSIRSCGPGSGTATPSTPELLGFLALLDSGANVAGGGDARPPTLSRPYYLSEVSCPAMPNATNKPPLARRRTAVPYEVAAQFVVDTNGRIERHSIRILPGTTRIDAAAARAAIVRWQFRPAEIDGTPVRQIVQTTVAFQDETDHQSMDTDTMRVESTEDGWVHVYRRSGVNGKFLQQWFEPDSVDTWLDRMWGRSPGNEIAPNDTVRLLTNNGLLGPRDGISLSSLLLKRNNGLELAIGFNGCGGSYNESGPLVGTGQRFGVAAHAARSARVRPSNPTSEVHTARDVSCPAWLPWVRSTRAGFERVWRYPGTDYPASMRKTNSRAEVLTSFIVDTAGFAEPASVVVMPGSDPRAAAAVPAALRELRFRPATRSGYRVRQRVIQALRFEPPPVCLTRDASPACPRRYSKD